MLNLDTLGIYIPGTSLIHRLQARTKLLLLLWTIPMLLIIFNQPHPLLPAVVLIVLTGAMLLLSRIPLAVYWARLRLLLIILVLGSVQLLFSDGKPLTSIGPFAISYGTARLILALYSIASACWLLIYLAPTRRLRPLRRRPRLRLLSALLGLGLLASMGLLAALWSTPASSMLQGSLTPTIEGMWFAVKTGLLLVPFLLAMVLSMTTTPVAVIDGAGRLLRPLRWLPLPIDDLLLMALLALRCIPILIDETQQLIRAQSARGASFAAGPLREQLQNLMTLLIPLIQGAFRRAADLASALEARGYRSDSHWTSLHEGAYTPIDYLLLFLLVLASGSLLA